MKIGFVVAMGSEYEPFLEKLGRLLSSEVVVGIEFCSYAFEDRVVVLAKCGIGEIASASAVSLLIGRFGCEYIVNFGFVGSLDGVSRGAVVAVRDVVHYDCDVTSFGHPIGCPCDMDSAYISADSDMLSFLGGYSRFSLPVVRLASGDKFVADPSFSEKIRSDFSANVCDMEGAGIAITCARAHIPFTMIKLISDAADDHAADDLSKSEQSAFGVAFDYVLAAIREAKAL